MEFPENFKCFFKERGSNENYFFKPKFKHKKEISYRGFPESEEDLISRIKDLFKNPIENEDAIIGLLEYGSAKKLLPDELIRKI